MTHPRMAKERVALRKERLEITAAQARDKARQIWSSENCFWGRHAPEGCQNTGVTCLCECHDR